MSPSRRNLVRLAFVLVLCLALAVSACARVSIPTQADVTATRSAAETAIKIAAIAPTVEPPTATPSPSSTPTLEPSPTLTPTPAGPSRTPTSTPAPTLDLPRVKAAIQRTLNTYSEAFAGANVDLLAQAVDQTPPFWRFVTMRFEATTKSTLASRTPSKYIVQDVRLRDHGFVEARIAYRDYYETYWLFREQGGKWVLAEPSEEQMGEAKTVTRGNFIFQTYDWADDTNAQVEQLMQNARQRVLAKLGKAPEQQATVWIKPIYAVSPFDSPSAVAIYDTGFRGAENIIHIYSPHSYGFGYYDIETGWQAELEDVLTHEYTHMTHRRNFGNVGEPCGWISEGLAEYVADSYRVSEVRAAVRAGTIIPIVDNDSPVYKQDLNHFYLLNKDRTLAYGFSVSLVRFVVKNYGGLDGLWKLAGSCNTNVKFEDALWQAFQVPFDQFDRDWRAWMKTF